MSDVFADAQIAYFSMEIGLEARMPTYAGGLGVLAGDTIRSAADLGLRMIAVTLLPRQGHFRQQVDETGWQAETPDWWPIERLLIELPPRVSVSIEGRDVHVRAWCYDAQGMHGARVPVLFLDTDMDDNGASDRELSQHLYGGDARYRLAQEAILGIGGVRMLRALGCSNIIRYHMNEGHSSLLVLELLHEVVKKEGASVATAEHVQKIRPLCVFTTHTPVAAGHDQFALELVHQVVDMPAPLCALEPDFCHEGKLNLTYLALAHSHYINGVAKRHGEISQHMFGRYRIDSITNGVHVATWASEPIQALLDAHMPGWREDNASLRHALALPRDLVWRAHEQNKSALVDYVNRHSDAAFELPTLTLGYARRMTAYKRAALILTDLEHLRQIAARAGGLQIVFAGKAHPQDRGGKELIQQILRARKALAASSVRIAFLLDYDMDLAKLMVAGADVWLNTPQPPLEASGTSGMKAAVNAVPSLSVLDGWWLEGCIEGVTGWAIGDGQSPADADPAGDVRALYDKLEQVAALYGNNRESFIDIMCAAMALNGSFFNTQRMVQQYVTKAYFQ